MLYLLLSIITSTLIVLIFNLFSRFQISNFQAIVFNYLTCFTCGWLATGAFPFRVAHWSAPWMPYALALGLIFIITFNITAVTVQYFGITLAAIMQRMSLLLSVPFAVILYQESLPILKFVGLLLALLAIVFANIRKEKRIPVEHPVGAWLWLFPFAIWVCSGVVEIGLLYVERQNAGQNSLLFTTVIFSTAAVIGVFRLLMGLVAGRIQFAFRNVIAGIALGIPNFGSVYFLLLALGAGVEGSVIFPINNVAIIGLATLTAWLLFSEKLAVINLAGVVLAVLAIILIAMAQ